VWALAGALTFHIGLHVLRFFNMFNGERDREDRSLSIFGDMIPWFMKAPNGCYYCTPMENFLWKISCRVFLLSDVLHFGEHVIWKDSHLRRMDLWHVKSCRDENRVLAGSAPDTPTRKVFCNTLHILSQKPTLSGKSLPDSGPYHRFSHGCCR
jgi:hypothetical protein